MIGSAAGAVARISERIMDCPARTIVMRPVDCADRSAAAQAMTSQPASPTAMRLGVCVIAVFSLAPGTRDSYFTAVSIRVMESNHAASRSSALPTRAISVGTLSYSACSIASRTPGTVFTP